MRAFNVWPVVLHPCGDEIRENRRRAGEPGPLSGNAYVCGHLEIEVAKDHDPAGGAAFSSRSDISQPPSSPDSEALAIWSAFCAHAPPDDRPEFAPHRDWVKQYMAQNGGRFAKVTATLASVEPFPPGQVLDTLQATAQMFGGRAYGPYLGVLRNTVVRVVESKARRTTLRPGHFTSDLAIPGNILFEMLREYVDPGSMTTKFEEGAVVVTMNDIKDAAKLLDNPDGLFHFGGAGFVQILGHVVWRWWLYDKRRTPQECTWHVEGSTQVTFHKYVSKDRHGGELTGALLHENDDTGAGAGGGKKGGGAGTRANSNAGLHELRTAKVVAVKVCMLTYGAYRRQSVAVLATATATAPAEDLLVPKPQLHP